MIALMDIKKAVNSALAPAGLKIYGNEIKEGFTRPCFFVNLLPLGDETFKSDTSERLFTIEVVYFSANRTDLENFLMYDIVKNLVSPVLTIGTRKLTTKKYRADVIDEEDHIYSIKFDLNFYDDIPDNGPTPDLMQQLNLNLKES